MSDSCGMFFLSMPGEYLLYKHLGDLHDDNSDGILLRATPAVAGAPREYGFDRIGANGGPGQPIPLYLPKVCPSLHDKLAATLTPSPASQAAVAAKGKGKGKGNGKDQRNAQCFKVREKRLSADLWRCEGQEYKGSHFPICAFTNNVGRRSPNAMVARVAKQRQLAAKSQREWAESSRSCGTAIPATERATMGAAEDAVGDPSSASSTPWDWGWMRESTQAGAARTTEAQLDGSDYNDWRGTNHWGGKANWTYNAKWDR
jgi:hypothetical protein